MLPRSMRTGGYDLPGVESSTVPLIGYRPLQPDGSTPSSRPGSSSDESETSQVSGVFFSLQPRRKPSVISPLERLTPGFAHRFPSLCFYEHDADSAYYLFLSSHNKVMVTGRGSAELLVG